MRYLTAGTVFVLLGLGALSLGATQAIAQGSLLDKGKSLLGSVTGKSSSSGSLSTGEIASGLREALKVGTDRVVGKLGVANGFEKNPEVHIPLPGSLHKAQSALRMVGASGMADDLELRLNRAAEAAVPKAKEIFWKAISDMSLDDVEGIYRGPKDAATQYLKKKMSTPLTEAMHPVVDKSLADAGAVKSYDAMMGKYKSLPMVPDVKANLTDYALEKTLSAVFLYLGREEAAIRDNPAQRSTELLKKVFGAGS